MMMDELNLRYDKKNEEEQLCLILCTLQGWLGVLLILIWILLLDILPSTLHKNIEYFLHV